VAGPAKVNAEIDLCAEWLRSGPDRPAQFFRTPAGLTNPFVHPALARRGMLLIGWTARGLDTWRRHPSAVAAAISRKAQPGAIILLHEGHHLKKSPDLNPRCLELTLEALARDGYHFVIPSVEQLRTTSVGK
jgi:hypothetical protein